MANHKSALKRIRQNRIKRMRNRQTRSNLRTMIKKVRVAVKDNNEAAAKDALASVIPLVDKAVSKGVIHWRNGSRKVSRLSKLVNTVGPNPEA